MKLTIPKIIAILLVTMTALFIGWTAIEHSLRGAQLPPGIALFYLIRGVVTSAVMIALTAWLMIHYRGRYEDELRRQSDDCLRMKVFFENIVQDAGEAIISLDNEGIIRSWNGAAETIYGYSASEIVGRSFRRLVPPDLLGAGEPERLQTALEAQGCVRDFDTRRIRKDGTIIRVRITRSTLRDAEGRPVGSSAIVRDITAEKELESRVIQSEKLAAIGQAAASTAHEVRNALAGIWGTIEYMQRTPAWRELPEEVGDGVKGQLTRIAHIIDDLLAYARPASPFRSPTDIQELLDRVIASVSGTPDGRGKQFVRRYEEGGLFASVDPVQLEQAFQNLVINACQAMGGRGTLEVAAAQRNGSIEVRFADTGAGMDRETLAHALEPFFTTKAKGTGLGLAIVRTIVEAHKGAIDIASQPGEGTTVRLTFPGADTRPIADARSSRPASAA